MYQNHVMNERFFADVVVRCEMSILRSVRQSVPKWENIALTEIEALGQGITSDSDLEQMWHDQYVEDQAFTLHETKNALLGGLAVSIASAVERVMVMLCKDRGETIPEGAGWGFARPTLDRLTRIDVSTINGFVSANRARLLGNCFKHNSGRRNEVFVRVLIDGQIDGEIHYPGEDWDMLLDGVQSFLLGLSELVWR